MRFNNKYYILRHGEATSNVKSIVSSWPEKFENPLTKKGREQIKEAAKKLEKKNIDIIFASPLLRTKQTAEIVGNALKIKPKFDERLVEQNVGVFNGRPFQELKYFFGLKNTHRFCLKPKNGETYINIKKRMVDFLKDVDKRYSPPHQTGVQQGKDGKAKNSPLWCGGKGKNILIVSHELPLVFLEAFSKNILNKDFYKIDRTINNGEIRELN